MMQRIVRIFVVEDDICLRSMIDRDLTSVEGFEVAASVGTLRDADAVMLVDYDIALVDLSLPDGQSFDLIRRISQKLHRKVLVLSALDDAKSVLEALGHGANGYVLKSLPAFELTEAINATLRGEAVISPAVARYLLTHLTNQSAWLLSVRRRNYLSDREREVLTAVANGLTRKEIARQLDISPYTVAEYLSNIYKKYMVTNKSAAVAKAIRQNDISR